MRKGRNITAHVSVVGLTETQVAIPARSEVTSTAYANHRLNNARFCSLGLAHTPSLYFAFWSSHTNIVVMELPTKPYTNVSWMKTFRRHSANHTRMQYVKIPHHMMLNLVGARSSRWWYSVNSESFTSVSDE
jgi:hypothetical protein